MNFFERQHQVRKASHRLVWLFALAVLAVVALVDLLVFRLFGLDRATPRGAMSWLFTVSLLTILLIGVTSWTRMRKLRRGGGGKIARDLGGVYVPEDTADPNLRRLRNVVEEISIASGTPVPEVYLLPDEPGINAFVAGWSSPDAALAVTQGALDRLNRSELQGIVAHEFSHIVNGDMRLNTQLMGVLFGILALAVVGRSAFRNLFRFTRGEFKDTRTALLLLLSASGPVIVLSPAALIAGYIGLFFGRLIKAAVSRQREHLADAAAVQFTRQTAGIAGALKKIGGLPDRSKLRSGHREEVSHMLFGDGMRVMSWFATHPPLVERIKALEPSFDPAELDELGRRWAQRPPSGLAEDQAIALAATHVPASDRPPGPPAPTPVGPDTVVASVGDPTAASYRHAENILRALPGPFEERARRPDTVVPLIFGLLMARDPQVRLRQHMVVAARHGRPLADAAWSDADASTQLPPTLRLPLAELAFSALRRRTRPELEHAIGTVFALIHADGVVDVFEYCLSTLLLTQLNELLDHRPPRAGRRQGLVDGRLEVATLLAVLARAGNGDHGAAHAAYRASLDAVLPGQAVPYAPPAQITALDAVWPTLDGLDVRDKALLVEGLVLVIAHDGVMTVPEIELLRAACGVLHCPLPPMVAMGEPAGRPRGS